MPHPTPVQIAYGSAAVISSTLLMLVISPTGSGLAVALIASTALLLGVLTAVAVQSRRDARAAAAAARTAVPVQRPAPVAAEPATVAAPRPREREEVRV